MFLYLSSKYADKRIFYLITLCVCILLFSPLSLSLSLSQSLSLRESGPSFYIFYLHFTLHAFLHLHLFPSFYFLWYIFQLHIISPTSLFSLFLQFILSVTASFCIFSLPSATHFIIFFFSSVFSSYLVSKRINIFISTLSPPANSIIIIIYPHSMY